MKIFKLEKFTRGWIAGDFEPSVIRTKDFEVGVRHYRKGDKEQEHIHKIITEVTAIVSGRFRMNDRVLLPGDIVQLSPNEPASFECLEDGCSVVIKTPSIPSDKHLIENNI